MRTFSALQRNTKKKVTIVSALNLNKAYQRGLCLVPGTFAFLVSPAFCNEQYHVLLEQLIDKRNTWILFFFYNPTQIIWITIVVCRRHAIRLKYICTIGAIVFLSSGYIAWIYNTVRFPLFRKLDLFLVLANRRDHVAFS